MDGIEILPVLVATVAAFVAAFAYYAVLGSQLARLGSAAGDGRPPGWMMPVELLRTLAVTSVVAVVVALGDVEGWLAGAALGAVLWVGFPVVLLSGSVVHEKVPWRLAALHAGDWLVKLVLVSVVLSAWS
ncbi:DUF1761 domain-containing protein [Cellulomonas cellasea]|uniref:DUF1761 domain-containing protein n=2 Tax=Cellulomonas cellasea TaxID=43670 RepID=A0A0A0BCN3_9CELL|nr:DUF1761 domain-containing protein [Cellulomonas cellasea]KGM03101.1 hypothetical protein Q760_09390 [Cellulomonas cellasea DSM 20118]GEA87836.1 hypothetical protein CCE01nite_17850 [Cellulomonas cellasea]